MSMIGTAVSSLEPSVARVTRSAPIPGGTISTAPAPPPNPAPAPVKAAAPAEDVTPDARFEAAHTARQVRQLVQRITATMAYGANVSVVSSGTSVHATIDISG